MFTNQSPVSIDSIIRLMQEKGLFLNNLYRLSGGGWRAIYLNGMNEVFLGDGETPHEALVNAEKKVLKITPIPTSTKSVEELFSELGF